MRTQDEHSCRRCFACAGAQWRRAVAPRARSDLGVVEPMPNLACRLDFAIRKFPDLGLLSGVVQGVRHEHIRQDSSDGKDDFSFHMNLGGVSVVAGGRGETTLRDGDAMLLSYSASRVISRPSPVDHRVIRLPRTLLGPLVPNIDDSVLCRIPCGTGMLNLLRSYVDALFDDPAIAMPEMRQLVITQLCDLIAVTLGQRAMQPRLPKVAASVWLGYAPSRATSKRTSPTATFRPMSLRGARRCRTAIFANSLRAKELHSRNSFSPADSRAHTVC